VLLVDAVLQKLEVWRLLRPGRRQDCLPIVVDAVLLVDAVLQKLEAWRLQAGHEADGG
jgi:hypothetical protein